jgi:hypothetical protein
MVWQFYHALSATISILNDLLTPLPAVFLTGKVFTAGAAKNKKGYPRIDCPCF